MAEVELLEPSVWSIASGRGSEGDVARLHADEEAFRRLLDRLILEAESGLASVLSLPDDVRDQVVADFTETLAALRATASRLRPNSNGSVHPHSSSDAPTQASAVEIGEVQLQASWSAGQIVVWAAGRGAPPEDNDQLATRLESIGGPPVGWRVHPGVSLPGGHHAEALAIPLKDALGWLVAVGSGEEFAEQQVAVGPSVRWLGRVALEVVRLVARGAIVPRPVVSTRSSGATEVSVRWGPALVDNDVLAPLVAAMPGTVVAVGGSRNPNGRAVATAVITAVAEAIVAESLERMELPAAPPSANSRRDLDDAVLAHMAGTPFTANAAIASELARRFDQWSRPVTDPSRPRLIVQLAAPQPGGVWLLSVYAPSRGGGLTPIDGALRAEGARATIAEWKRLGRLLPALDRSGAVE